MKTTGHCLCGQIVFEIEGKLAPIELCHCSQCRRAQGTAFAANIPVAASQFRLLTGEDSLSGFESSPGKERVFCRRCGSPIFSRRASAPEVLRVRAGLLDGPLETPLAGHAFTDSRADWWQITDDLPQFPGPRPQA
ncbi:GFA family protein [Marinobacter sp.]|uniref:GFA family protein n=1 Tax=Marinobacter sp. TaxID=50741 RepID=UPI003A92D6FA